MPFPEIVTELISWFFSNFGSLEQALEACLNAYRLCRFLAGLVRAARWAHRWIARWCAARRREPVPPSSEPMQSDASPHRLAHGDDPAWTPVLQVQHDPPLFLIAPRQDDELCIACGRREDTSHLEVYRLTVINVSDDQR